MRTTPGFWEEVENAVRWLKERLPSEPWQIGLVLGSGLGSVADRLTESLVFPASEIPGFPVSTVAGHSGRLIAGRWGGVPLLIQQGRVHFYEGYGMDRVVFPVRVFGRLGIRDLILTNAAGALNPVFAPGDLMLIVDHLNLMGTNPLMGPNDERYGPRFPDMSSPYDPALLALAIEEADKIGIPLRRGVLAAVSGPSYETAAEVRMLRLLGADAVCMSTVPEVIAAVHMGLHILGISCITNRATGLSERPLSHREVESTAREIENRLARLLEAVIPRVGKEIPLWAGGM